MPATETSAISSHVCNKKPLAGSAPEQLVFNETTCCAEMMCSACGTRWLHEDSDRLWFIWTIGFETGANRAVHAAMQIHAPTREGNNASD